MSRPGTVAPATEHHGRASTVAAPRSIGTDLSDLAPRPRARADPNATLVARVRLTPELAWLRVRPDVRLPFMAGQYVQLGIPHPATPSRAYSIASVPGARDLDFLVARVEGGALSPRLVDLPAGSRLFVGRPVGRFRLEADGDRDHLLVGTGSGVAPLLSMLAALRTRPRPPRTFLLHGARSLDGLAAHAALSTLDEAWFAYRPVLSRPTGECAWMGPIGHVDARVEELLGSGHLRPATTVAYLCGSPAMIRGVAAVLRDAGVPAAGIHAETFEVTGTA